jgi:hypothetical protein
MNRLSTIRTGRKGRVALGLGAAAIIGVAIVGGAAAANASSTPASKPDGAPIVVPVDGAPTLVPVDGAPTLVPVDGAPTVVPVDGAPDLTKVRQGDGPHSVPIKPRIGSGTEELSLVEVPGAAPDFDSVQEDTATAIDAVPQPIDTGTTTLRR